jgi:hypothetical protein
MIIEDCPPAVNYKNALQRPGVSLCGTFCALGLMERFRSDDDCFPGGRQTSAFQSPWRLQ